MTMTDSDPRSELTTAMVSSFATTRLHRSHSKPVSSLHYTLDGTLLASSSLDNTLILYDALTGLQRSNINLSKYGCSVSRFLSDARSTLLIASTLVDNHVRALDVEYKRYVRTFDAHDTPVLSVSSSPASPHFLSASRDSTICLWDARSQYPVARVSPSGTAPIVSYDPKGLIFGVAHAVGRLKTSVKLYDARQYTDGPFLEFPIDNQSDSPPTCLKFSSDGEYFLLVNSNVNAAVNVYDAYKGELFRCFKGHSNTTGVSLEASFSPDSAYITSGSDDGSVYTWNLSNERLLMTAEKYHALPSTSVIWNPVYAQMASACQNVALWMPKLRNSY